MAITGLATYQNRSMYYSSRRDVKDFNPDSNGSFMNQMLTFHGKEGGKAQAANGDDVSVDSEIDSELRFGAAQSCSPVGKYGELKPYTRCITANIKTKEMIASESDGEMIYSYQEEEKSFNIFINSDGENKTYTIKGVDENGQEIEEEFDPYHLDPEMMDFPEFSALCMYIRQTDETADLMSRMVFTDTSHFDGIFEKGDRVPLLKDYAEEYREVTPSLAELASNLFDAINEFFDNTLWNKNLNEEKLQTLFEDKDSKADNSYEPVKETVNTTYTEYRDPETGKVIPVSLKYTTAYSEDGITCRKDIKDGDTERSRELWSLDFKDKEDLSKVRELLSRFDDQDRLTFATQKKFWEDYLSGNMDVEGFKEYYNSTNNGVIDFENRMREGEALRDIINEPYAEYFNNQSFIGHVWTEQEMWDDWNAKIEASSKAAKTDGEDIEPPTETILTANGNSHAEKPVWNWYDGRFGYRVDVFKNEDAESEYTVRLRYDNGREESRIVDVDKIDASNCNIVDLQVKMASLRDKGKISQEDYMMNMVVAHFNMEHWMPKADENAMVDFRNIFERQLELEMRNGRNDKHIAGMLNLLRYL